MAEGTDARAEILRGIRKALGSPPRLSAEAEWHAIPRTYIVAGGGTLRQRIDRLCDRLRDYGAGVFLTEPAQLRSTIAEALSARNKREVVVPGDLDPEWLPGDNCGCIFIPDRALSRGDIDRCNGVLTGSTIAVAETGTLCLCHGERSQGRRVLTLLPDYHLCVVRGCDVVETVPEAIRALAPHKIQPITFISGPSATSDIEMTRIQGVHGPRMLDVVVIL